MTLPFEATTEICAVCGNDSETVYLIDEVKVCRECAFSLWRLVIPESRRCDACLSIVTEGFEVDGSKPVFYCPECFEGFAIGKGARHGNGRT